MRKITEQEVIQGNKKEQVLALAELLALGEESRDKGETLTSEQMKKKLREAKKTTSSNNCP